MNKQNIFTPQNPKIGIERYLFSNIKICSFQPIDETEKFDGSKIDSTYVENLLNKNTNNLNKYKGEGVYCIYNEKIFEEQIYIINYNNLINILSFDDSGFDNFIGPEKGKWIQSKSEFFLNYKNEKERINPEHLDENNFTKKQNDFFINDNFIIQFESRFESGNLRMALQISELEYDLILKNDINAGKTSNWFFFRVKILNKKKIKLTEYPISIKFNIINCQKLVTLFNKGLKVLFFSENLNKWSRNTKNNYYFSNTISIEEKKLFTLTFTVELNYDFLEENLYFSYCYPYTFTNVQEYLGKILNNPVNLKTNIIRHEIIGKSLAGNNLDMLIITKFISKFEDIAYRPCIILTSRVHPGESNSSFVIQGVIDFLIDPKNSFAEELRKNFIFKIIPMLNPDGVINGNFRTSLIGKDLNRLWDDPRENICPTIFYTKEMIKKTLLSRDIFLYCDFHGHSNKPNFFLYGCPVNKKIKPNSTLIFQEMILSKIFSEKNNIFDHKSCIYKIAAKKLKTARAVVRNELNVDLSYCLESSIGYISIGENKGNFFTPLIYVNIGKDFSMSILDLFDKNIFNEILLKVQSEETNKINAGNLSITNNMNIFNSLTLQTDAGKNPDNNNIYFNNIQENKNKKKKKKLNPIKTKRIQNQIFPELQSTQNMKYINQNSDNNLNINININNINNINFTNILNENENFLNGLNNINPLCTNINNIRVNNLNFNNFNINTQNPNLSNSSLINSNTMCKLTSEDISNNVKNMSMKINENNKNKQKIIKFNSATEKILIKNSTDKIFSTLSNVTRLTNENNFPEKIPFPDIEFASFGFFWTKYYMTKRNFLLLAKRYLY